MATKQTGTWLTIIPMEFRDIPEFWQRDAGLVCLGFRGIGVTSRFIALGEPGSRDDLPLILATRQQMEDAIWWRQWQAQGVVLWASHKVEGIARAIKATGARLVMHMDTDGLCSTRVAFWPYLYQNYHIFRSDGRHPAGLLSVAKSFIYHFFPSLHDRHQQAHAELADLITINSPLAQQRVRRLLTGWGRSDLAQRVKVIPSPLGFDAGYDSATVKRPQIVAAGRWQSYQKDPSKAMQVLAQVLQTEAQYSAVMVGSGMDVLERYWKELPAELRLRIRLEGYLERARLLKAYQESQIMFVSSRFESLNLAAVEALACGCSLVGWAGVPSFGYLVSASSGTLATSRATSDYSDAICAEIEAWRGGERNPERISQHWRERFLATKYASSVLEHFQGVSLETR